ncbi:MAG: hypothetical protein KJO07_23425 [Deltaproteobacteria bacterium]|nr:hypothetical protein [Deltaproteobacteria bacterium]
MRILVATVIALTAAAGTASADMPDKRAELRAKIRAKALVLRVERVSKRLSLDSQERTQLRAVLEKHDAGRLALRRQRRNLRREMKRLSAKDERKSGELFERLMAHKRKALDLELARADELRRLLGSNRGLRAVVILTRVERRIEARMRQAMGKSRRGKGRRGKGR